MTAPPRQITALCAAADALGRAGVRWVVAGSLGRALLGCDVRPRDVDLELDPDGADGGAAAMGAALAVAGGGGRRSRRASVQRAGVEVDLTSALAVEAPGGALEPAFAMQWEWAHPLVVAGRAVRVAPLEEGVCRAVALGDWAGVAKIAAQAATAPGGVRLSAAYVAERLASASSRAAR